MVVAQKYMQLDAALMAQALDEWQSRWPGMALMALLPEQEKSAVTLLQQACRERGMVLMGAIFPALVTDAGFSSEGVWLVCFDKEPAHRLQTTLDAPGIQALAQWSAATVAQHSVRPTLFFVFDAMVPNIGSVMDELHLALPRPPHYVGVNAGSETFSAMPCLFNATDMVGDGVLVIDLGAPVTTAVRHVYPVSNALMRATAAQGNRIIHIDGRPAFEVYQEVIAREYGVALTRENFYDYAVHFPFGVVTVVDVLVRIPVALGEDQSLVCVGEIAPNAALRLLRAPELADSDCVSELVDALGTSTSALQSSGGGLMTFYCAGRRMHFGQDSSVELETLRQSTGVAHLFGALSLGEIDSIEDLDAPRFHNAALVCVA